MNSRDRSNDPAPPLTFPVIVERLAVHKTVADNGGVRLRKIVHCDVSEIDEALKTDSVNITRVPVGRDVDGPVEVRYEEGVTIIPVVEERLVVRRQLVLTEEVHVSRSTHITRTPQSIQVRREEIIVERQAPGSATWTVEDGTS
jgi:uncharacterized protein (TIGR02271 family)